MVVFSATYLLCVCMLNNLDWAHCKENKSATTLVPSYKVKCMAWSQQFDALWQRLVAWHTVLNINYNRVYTVIVGMRHMTKRKRAFW